MKRMKITEKALADYRTARMFTSNLDKQFKKFFNELYDFVWSRYRKYTKEETDFGAFADCVFLDKLGKNNSSYLYEQSVVNSFNVTKTKITMTDDFDGDCDIYFELPLKYIHDIDVLKKELEDNYASSHKDGLPALGTVERVYTDFPFLKEHRVTWVFSDIEGNQYFDITDGQNKVTYCTGLLGAERVRFNGTLKFYDLNDSNVRKRFEKMFKKE